MTSTTPHDIPWSAGAWTHAPVAVDDSAGERVLVRVSWSMGAVIVRAGLVDGPLRLLRVAPFPETLAATAGPFLAAPTREGLAVRFHAWRVTDADASIH